MAGALPFITAGASIFSMFSKKKESAPQQQAQPIAPTTDNAAAEAKAQLEKKRRQSLLQGGNTDLTKGTALAGASDVGKKSLLGQ